MKTDRHEFLRFANRHSALTFGQFTLKSGRISPYFFNIGVLNSGRLLATLGQHYADTLLAAGVEFDLLFGAAYKGIPLVSSLLCFSDKAMAVADTSGIPL